MEALQKVFDAIKTVLDYLKTLIAEIMAAAGLKEEETTAPANE